jgi:hypothetical protein
MRKGGGKAKGSQFEREVAVALSNWISNNQKSDIFWRSSTSGGRATTAMKSGKKLSNQVGDLSCIDQLGSKFINTFAVEIKFYADLDFKGLITGKGKLLEFWDEIKKQAADHKKFPLLIARQNRIKPIVCVSFSSLALLGFGEYDTILISRPFDLCLLEFDRFVREGTPFV